MCVSTLVGVVVVDCLDDDSGVFTSTTVEVLLTAEESERGGLVAERGG